MLNINAKCLNFMYTWTPSCPRAQSHITCGNLKPGPNKMEKESRDDNDFDVRVNYFALILNVLFVLGWLALLVKCILHLNYPTMHFDFLNRVGKNDHDYEKWLVLPIMFASASMFIFHMMSLCQKEREFDNERKGPGCFSVRIYRIVLVFGTLLMAVALIVLYLLKSSDFKTIAALDPNHVKLEIFRQYSYEHNWETFGKVFWPLLVPVFLIIVHFPESKAGSWTNCFKPWYLYKKTPEVTNV